MNVDVKARWVAALRSGDYAQGTKRLCSVTSTGERRYCCLGVLCHLAAEAGVITEREDLVHGRVVYSRADDDEFESAHLPRAVVEWADLRGIDPVVTVRLGDYEGKIERTRDRPSVLSYVNDDGASFDVVARLIEEQL